MDVVLLSFYISSICFGLLLFVTISVGLYLRLKRFSSQGRRGFTIGFFHPYCNAGGGGERVLYTAIRALQNRYDHVNCVVYTGDVEASSSDIIERAKQRFNIELPRSVQFVFLRKRRFVEASMYPVFTMLGQSLGSIVLGLEAALAFVPDVYMDSMGYAFTLPIFRYLAGCTVGCYVHYPTISCDMLEQVTLRRAAHNNASLVARSAILSALKLYYYRLFAWIYGLAGRSSHYVMVNSSWTRGHIAQLWSAAQAQVVFPPCDTRTFLNVVRTRSNARSIVSCAQFRPEKDHPLQLRAFHRFIKGVDPTNRHLYKLQLVGSCRNDEDAQRVANLKRLTAELNIESNVEFHLNASFEQLLIIMGGATVGLHTMWNEHFGIGVVECMAAGCVMLAHRSGGPLEDIVKVNGDDLRTGFLADSEESYAQALGEIFVMDDKERGELVSRARKDIERFSEQRFEASLLTVLSPFMDRA